MLPETKRRGVAGGGQAALPGLRRQDAGGLAVSVQELRLASGLQA